MGWSLQRHTPLKQITPANAKHLAPVWNLSLDNSTNASNQPLVIDGRTVGDLREEWIPYLNLFNLSSHPAIAIPVGLDGDGLPVSLDVLGVLDQIIIDYRAREIYLLPAS